MQLRSLQAFVAVVQTGSFVAAADHLCTVQSNITAHIKKLEQQLGVLLLNRSKGVQLTPAGRLLLDHASQLLALHRQTEQLFSEQAGIRGSLQLGSMETTLAVRLPPYLVAFHQRYPEVDIQMLAGPSAETLQQLQAGKLDAIFVAGPQPGNEWVQQPVFHEELVLVSAQPLTALPDAGALSRATFLAFRQGCSYRQRIELLLNQQGAYAPRILELGSLDAMLGCAAAGMGYALLPRSVVEQQPRRYELHCLALPAALGRISTYLVAAPEAGWSPQLRAFYQLVVEQDVQG